MWTDDEPTCDNCGEPVEDECSLFDGDDGARVCYDCHHLDPREVRYDEYGD